MSSSKDVIFPPQKNMIQCDEPVDPFLLASLASEHATEC